MRNSKLNEMLEKLDQGFPFEFIVRDSGVKPESVMLQMFRAKAAGKLSQDHIRKIWPQQ